MEAGRILSMPIPIFLGLNEPDQAMPDHEPSPLQKHEISVSFSPLGLTAGSRVGRFVILGELGQGGMGVLYLAYDPQLDRRVALKLFHSGNGKDRADEELRRLREAQALARLSHPNVVAVYEVGTFEGSVFLALEYIHGSNLEQWAEAEPRSVQEIIRVFTAAAQGLAAAHEAGILHRDVKPANIMIGPSGRARLVDFGLARATGPAAGAANDRGLEADDPTVAEAPSDGLPLEASPTAPGGPSNDPSHPGWTPSRGSAPLASPLTMPGSVLGTPGYLAPEVLDDAEADERSDIYSLCASIYRLLYGHPPHKILNLADLTKIANEQVEFPPQGRNLPIPSWIRTILAKGLEPDPQRRFSSVGELAEALERDPTMVRKQRAGAAALLLAATAIGAGLVSFAQAPEPGCDAGSARVASVWGAPQKARLEKGFHQLSTPLAADAWPMVEKSLDEYTELWQQAFQDACEATYVRRDQSEELFDLRNQCLSERLMRVEALVDILAEVDHNMVERSTEAIAKLPNLVPCSDERQLRATMTPDLDDETKDRVDRARDALADADAHQLAGQFSSAFERAQPLLPGARSGALPGLQAEVLHQLGIAKTELGHYPEARDFLMEATAAALSEHRDELAVEAFQDLAWVEGNYLRHLQTGFQWLNLAEGLVKRLGARPYLTAQLLRTRGSLRFFDGDYRNAERSFREVLLVMEELDASHGIGEMSVLATRGATAMNLAVVLRIRGKTRESLDQYDLGIRCLSEVFGEKHPTVAETRFNRGTVLMDLGREQEAVAEIETSLEHLRQALGDDHPRLGIPLNNLGVVLEGQGRLGRAMQLYQQALVIYKKAYPEGHFELARTLRNLAEGHLQLDDPGRARKLAQEALAMIQNLAGDRHPEVVGPLHILARLDLRDGFPERVVAPMRLAIEVTEQEDRSPLRADFFFYLAQALREMLQNQDEAIELAETARRLLEEGGPSFQAQIEEIDRWLANGP